MCSNNGDACRALQRRPGNAAGQLHPVARMRRPADGPNLLQHRFAVGFGGEAQVHPGRGPFGHHVAGRAAGHDADVDGAALFRVGEGVQGQNFAGQLLDGAEAVLDGRAGVRGFAGNGQRQIAHALAAGGQRFHGLGGLKHEGGPAEAGLLVNDGAGVDGADLLIRVDNDAHVPVQAPGPCQRLHHVEQADDAAFHVNDARPVRPGALAAEGPGGAVPGGKTVSM